ncbi:hypothetical protein ACFQU2_08255 [Siccirubricoccus deserti]|uniref:Uncharacterized protein n=1 Tax=Siccirubricoccus deserti TaxID=2013562 RepID=A0A9X0UF41_9PROT|nr:hypothetical protein [Siccirubricoccus deserti]MBC4017531.1 hypothetical protein [Siccirubricoccus deserti]
MRQDTDQTAWRRHGAGLAAAEAAMTSQPPHAQHTVEHADISHPAQGASATPSLWFSMAARWIGSGKTAPPPPHSLPMTECGAA